MALRRQGGVRSPGSLLTRSSEHTDRAAVLEGAANLKMARAIERACDRVAVRLYNKSCADHRAFVKWMPSRLTPVSASRMFVNVTSTSIGRNPPSGARRPREVLPAQSSRPPESVQFSVAIDFRLTERRRPQNQGGCHSVPFQGALSEAGYSRNGVSRPGNASCVHQLGDGVGNTTGYAWVTATE